MNYFEYKKDPETDPDMQKALRHLKNFIRKHYPEATFHVERAIDDPQSVNLVTSVDVDDINEVFDIVLPTIFKFQDQGLPIHVIPLRFAKQQKDTNKIRYA